MDWNGLAYGLCISRMPFSWPAVGDLFFFLRRGVFGRFFEFTRDIHTVWGTLMTTLWEATVYLVR